MATCDLAFGTQLSRTCFTDGHTVSCPTEMLCLLLEHVACLKGGPKCCRLVSKPKTKMKKRLSHDSETRKDGKKVLQQSPSEQDSFFGSIL